MRFSERNGYKSVREIIQKDSINQELKNRLWNIVIFFIFNQYKKDIPQQISSPIHKSNLNTFFSYFYHTHLKSRIDQVPNDLEAVHIEMENLFFEEYHWYEIYDFFEFCIKNYPFDEIKTKFIVYINNVLQEESSAYRVINESIIEVTSEQEIQSIEDALVNTNPYSGVQQHLNQALKLISDRQNPDYRNSIKESISAVESICKIITQDDKATLGKALKIIEDKHGLHAALKASLSQLYGYTSDADGIRHAMLAESHLSYIDAKFMLVACTNFINYLIEKAK